LLFVVSFAMNAPTMNDLRNAVPARDFVDDRMSQVRDLLIGDHVRANEARIAAIELRIRDLETELAQRLNVLQQRIETLASDTTVDRQTAFDELARSVADLGDKIRVIAR